LRRRRVVWLGKREGLPVGSGKCAYVHKSVELAVAEKKNCMLNVVGACENFLREGRWAREVMVVLQILLECQVEWEGWALCHWLRRFLPRLRGGVLGDEVRRRKIENLESLVRYGSANFPPPPPRTSSLPFPIAPPFSSFFHMSRTLIDSKVQGYLEDD